MAQQMASLRLAAGILRRDPASGEAPARPLQNQGLIVSGTPRSPSRDRGWLGRAWSGPGRPDQVTRAGRAAATYAVPTRSVLFVVSAGTDSMRRSRIEGRCLEVAGRNGLPARALESPDGRSDWRGRVVSEVQSAVAEGTDLVVAIGGDGTVGACAEGVCGTGATLAVIPCGAANLFARALDIPFGFEAALAVAFVGSDHRVDVALANGRAVVTMAGIGLDAAVVAATSAASKQALGWLGYGVATLPRLYDHPYRFQVRLDGATAMTLDARSVVVVNAGRLPAGLAPSPRLRPDDGLLDVTVLAPRGPFGWAALIWQMSRGGRRGGADRLASCQAGTVAISAEVELPRQLDGESITASSELVVRIAERALRVRLPRA